MSPIWTDFLQQRRTLFILGVYFVMEWMFTCLSIDLTGSLIFYRAFLTYIYGWVLMSVNMISSPFSILLNRKRREDVPIESVWHLKFLTKLQSDWDLKITYTFPFIPMLRKIIILHATICPCSFITLETRYFGETMEKYMQKNFLMLNLRLNKNVLIYLVYVLCLLAGACE